MPGFGWRHPRDIAAGLPLGITEIPDGRASALLAGVSPALRLFAVIAGGAVGALLVSITSALAAAAGDAVAGLAGGQRVVAMARRTLMGGCQILPGARTPGCLTRFMTNAVTPGFLAGIGVSIVLSWPGDLTG